MRNLSATSLAKISQKLGTEPILIVEIGWSTNSIMYSSRKIPELGLVGKILEVGNIQHITSINRINTDQSVQIRLDDTDGSIKQIFNNVDIHKKSVWLWQWFSDIPLTEKFLLFRGQITSPIIWSEADRSISFDVLSVYNTREVGYSPEEGSLGNLPDDAIGQVWPLVFGYVYKLPGILIDKIPQKDEDSSSGETALKEPLSLADPTLKHELRRSEKSADEAAGLALLYIIGYLQASSAARRAGEVGELEPLERGNGKYTNLARQYLDLGNQFLLESQKIRQHSQKLNEVKKKQETYKKDSVQVTNGINFPQQKTLKININGAQYTGYFIGDTFNISEAKHPGDDLVEGMESTLSDAISLENGYPTIARQTMFFANGGTTLTYFQADTSDEEISPIRYVVSALLPVTVIAAFAFKTGPDKIKRFTKIPQKYYTIQNKTFGFVAVTLAKFKQPLSSRDEGWEDEVYFNCYSILGGNIVDTIIYIINNYTSLSFDVTSFNETRTRVAAFPANFALLEKKDALQFIEDIAYQSRCAVWIKNNVVYLKYLAYESNSVDTITNADIINNTLEIGCTNSDDIITKYVATWKPNYKRTKNNKVVLRNNILKYGLSEQSIDYYIYTQGRLVQYSSIFWMNRLSNMFKIIKFKTPLHKLNLEPFDTITLNLIEGMVSTGPISGCIIQEMFYDIPNHEISFTVWVPIKLGQMTKFRYSYPGSLTIEQAQPTPEEQANAGSPGPGRESTLPEDDRPIDGSVGNGGGLNVSYRFLDWPYQNFEENQFVTPDITEKLDQSTINKIDNPNSSFFEYQYRVFEAPKEPDLIPKAEDYPGYVSDGGNGIYEVDVYFNGLNGKSSLVKEVYQVEIDDTDDPIPPGTACIVSEVIEKDEDQNWVLTYYMQVPVWG